MNTIDKAKNLWCPMVRIAQIGASETSATYNRAFIKSHVAVKLRNDEGEDVMGNMLVMETQIPAASRCLADGCGVWAGNEIEGCCGLSRGEL